MTSGPITKPRVCVLRAPGTNCDVETAFAFESAGAIAERVHLFRLLEEPQTLAGFQILCIPGGFSYGDDIGAGVVFGAKLQRQLSHAIGEFLQRDTLTLGICNGFQVLLRSGILPDGTETWPPPLHSPPSTSGGTGGMRDATLTWNANGRYTALWVQLEVDAPDNAFLRGIDLIEMPLAHAEGRIAVRSRSVLDRWRENNQIALRYASPEGVTLEGDDVLPYPINPNGSAANIAGLGDPTGRVLGLMPHPERFLFATQHPQWTRRRLSGDGAGMQIFRNAVSWFE